MSEPDVLKRATPRTVPIKALHPNPWNYKPMTQQELDKEIASIRKHGFLVPTCVRPHPSKAKAFEILDGEHRWKALKALGLDSIHVMDVGEVSDTEAKEIMIVLNELRGQVGWVQLSAVIADVHADIGIADMVQTFPFAQDELEALLNYAHDPLDDIAGKPVPEQGIDAADWVSMHYQVPAEAKKAIEATMEKVLKTLDVGKGPRQVRYGLALEHICTVYRTSGKKPTKPRRSSKSRGGRAGDGGGVGK